MTPETTTPAGLFGSALLDGTALHLVWTTPPRYGIAEHPRDGGEVIAVGAAYPRGETAALHVEVWYCGSLVVLPLAGLSLMLTRSACRAHLCRVLAAGERCRHCTGATEFACTACCGTGYLRKPAPAWFLLPVSEGGSLPASIAHHSPAFLSRHARLVAAGGRGIVGVLGGWYYDAYMRRWARDSMTRRQDAVVSLISAAYANGGATWQVDDEHGCGIAFGKETDDAGKAKADAAALRAGYALLTPDGLVMAEVGS